MIKKKKKGERERDGVSFPIASTFLKQSLQAANPTAGMFPERNLWQGAHT
jgi:hypothetical protein